MFLRLVGGGYVVRDDDHRGRSVWHMDCQQFRALLAAAGRVEAREQQMALTVSAFPYMDDAGQHQVRGALAAATGSAQEEDEEAEQVRGEERNIIALRELRDLAKLRAAMDGGRADAI